jgi:tRNA(Ile2) C34 agmatinyltransferase TiaS
MGRVVNGRRGREGRRKEWEGGRGVRGGRTVVWMQRERVWVGWQDGRQAASGQGGRE